MLVCFRRDIKMLDFDRKLIVATQKREILYNPANMSRMYQNEKAEAWSEVAEELETSVKVCKTRWASLRDRYRRIHKIEQDAFLSGKQLYYKWKWYKPLSFLLNSFDDARNDQENSIITELEIERMLSTDQFQNVVNASPGKIKKFEVQNLIENCSLPPAKVRMLALEEVKPFNFSKSLTLRNGNDDASELFFKSLAIRTKQAGLSVQNLVSLEAGIIRLLCDMLKEIEDNKKRR